MKSRVPTGRVAVLIPLYKSALSAAEEFSLRNTLDVLRKRDIFVIGPEKLREFLESYKKKTGLCFQLSLYKDKFFSSINGYNSLLMTKSFYTTFAEYEYILISQTDALVFSDQLDSWCQRNYSYIGAPWFVGFDKPQKPLAFFGVGNGGLSLRKVNDFIRFLSVPRWMPNAQLRLGNNHNVTNSLIRTLIHKYLLAYNFAPLLPRINEDGFWGLLAPQCCSFFTVPTAQEAVAFAFEAEPRYMYELNHQQLPFGCHAWERYDRAFWEQELIGRGIKFP